MVDNLALFSKPELKTAIQELKDLLSQTNLAFLIGAGCSLNAGLPLMYQLTEQVLIHEKISEETKVFLQKIKLIFEGAENATIEDYMSEIVDLLSISERRKRKKANYSKVKIGESECNDIELLRTLKETQEAISSIISNKEVNVSFHQMFVKLIHRSLQAGKSGKIIDYFILNYDTLIEDALGLEKVVYSDGFSGAVTSWWKPQLFSNKDIEARVFKIHGSIDWCVLDGDTIPRRIRSGIKPLLSKNHVLIYPSATKYQETQRDPFAQMFTIMRESLVPSENNQKTLVICGYSFGDNHINLEIENALLQSKERLTLIVFCEYLQPEGCVRSWLENSKISEQIWVYKNDGVIHGNSFVSFTENIPWWKFEILVQILGGVR